MSSKQPKTTVPTDADLEGNPMIGGSKGVTRAGQTPNDLEEALDAIGATGALEVLVEAGPAVTQAVLGSGLWDEHAVIRHMAGPGGVDRAEIRGRDGGVSAVDLV